MRKIKKLILHCTATKEGINYDVDTVRKWHIQSNGWSDIGYHYLIYLNGYIAKGRDENCIGAHCYGHNTYSIGICYVGGLDKNGSCKDTRTPEQKESLFTIVHKLLNKYKLKITDVYCHNQFANKSCPCFNIEDFRREYIEYFNV